LNNNSSTDVGKSEPAGIGNKCTDSASSPPGEHNSDEAQGQTGTRDSGGLIEGMVPLRSEMYIRWEEGQKYILLKSRAELTWTNVFWDNRIRVLDNQRSTRRHGLELGISAAAQSGLP